MRFLFFQNVLMLVDSLKKSVIEEPISIFQSKYSASITPVMVRVMPIIKAKWRDHTTGNLDVQYKVDPVRNSEAYEQTNLIDVMAELTKKMPSWSLCIVTNPPRYAISDMLINKYGVTYINKSIVLDRTCNASVYINCMLDNSYCKHYVNAADIINVILDLNSL